MQFDSTDTLAVNTVRMLSVAQVQAANSGHPGLPLGVAPMAYVLFRNHLTIDPQHPDWFNRDRFILSAGHGSAMLYSLYHLAGFNLTLDDLRHFRQFGSKTPGHPEFGVVPGVEATTGPLGQGLGMAVGMAMAERHLNARFAQAVDHHTYAIVSDGDLMEGIAYEAMALAGHQQLGKLVVLYDSNDISLDGPNTRAFGGDVAARCASAGWHYLRVERGDDLAAIDAAITTAKAQTEKPTLIEVRTIIGQGAHGAGTNAVHGKPLNAADYAALKEHYNWQLPDFTVPAAVTARFKATINARGQIARATWRDTVAKLAPALYNELARAIHGITGQLPELPSDLLPAKVSGRDAGMQVLNAFAPSCPDLWGGSADLASSTKTVINSSPLFAPDTPAGRNIAFGVREFAMGTALNGIALHGGSRVFGSTFLVFADYVKPAIRLAALQHLPVIFVFTHDSIAVGEDGPTHEPIEQLAMLRTIPNTVVLRPADGSETAAAWRFALERQDGPTVLALTRQDLPALSSNAADISRGAYIVRDVMPGKLQEGILMASGSEVFLALQAQQELAKAGRYVSVISMPSFELFKAQSAAYQAKIMPPAVTKRLAIEMGSSMPWGQFVGLTGRVLGIDSFGASGNPDRVQAHFGFTVQNAVDCYLDLPEQQLLHEII